MPRLVPQVVCVPEVHSTPFVCLALFVWSCEQMCWGRCLQIRRVAAGTVLVAMCASVATRTASLLTASTTAALVLVAMQCITLEQVFTS